MRISASFDDGSVEDVHTAELMRKYDIETTFYWPVEMKLVNESAGREGLNKHQANAIAAYHEVGSHTLTHPNLTRVSRTQQVEEIRRSREILQDMFNQPINKFCYPKGYANDEIRGLVSVAGYESARNVGVGNLYRESDKYWLTPTVHIAGVKRKEYADATWYEEGLRLFEEAKKIDRGHDEAQYHIWGHSWEIEKFGQFDMLEKFLKEIAQ